MGYLEKIRLSREKSHHSGVASRILTLMDKLREDATQNSARRWVWELLQNAKDVAEENRGVAVQITTAFANNQPSIEFGHNGRMFNVDNITFLIEQNSTKDRTPQPGEKPKTTGKFGTGFLTTHLLSEKVSVSGILKEPELPYQQFELVLDRSGRDISSLTQSVEVSIELLEGLVSQPSPMSVQPNNDHLNTKFRYQLNEEGVRVTELGLSDLHRSLPYVMAFNPSIKVVSLPQEGVMYTLGVSKEISEGLLIIEVKKIAKGIAEAIQIVVAIGEKSSVAAEIENKNGKIYILPFDKELPRLFCDFPLIGTHTFPFPGVANSSFFNPTEPRDGVTFIDKDEPKFIENKEILSEGLSGYLKIITYASENNWKGLYNIISTSLPNESLKWVSRDWYELAIQKPLRDFLIKIPLIDHLELGRVALRTEANHSVHIPYHARGDESHRIGIREQLWDLYNHTSHIMPPKEEIHDWAEVIWAEEFHLGIEFVMQRIEICSDLSELKDVHIKDEITALAWLNKFYLILSQDQHCLDLLHKGTYEIIPNQNGQFCKKSALSLDIGIEETLKDVLQILGNDWKNFLLHAEVVALDKSEFSIKNQEMIIEAINRELNNERNAHRRSATNLLLSCFSNDSNFPAKRKQMYEFCFDLFGDEMPEARIIKNWDSSIWKVADDMRVGRIIETVAAFRNISTLSTSVEVDRVETVLTWIKDLIEFLIQHNYSSYLNNNGS